MRDQREQTSDYATPDERHVLIDNVEILDPEPTPEEVASHELLALLVAHFEESLIRKEHELIALRRSLEDAERDAAEVQHALQQELETANQVSRILERENQRLAAEIEALRRQIDESQYHQNGAAGRIQELERENRRLIAEIDELRRQASPSSPAETDDTLLETLLTHDLSALPVEPPRTASQARRFRKRASTL
jgi:septal ring factor EnvC (AmiA/AmiB activator)